jgi:hypothetical protein
MTNQKEIDANESWEQRVRKLEEEGLTRSDAQAVVDAEDQRESTKERDANLARIGSHIYKSFQEGQISFSECEAALELLNTCTNTLILAIPENYLTRAQFEKAIEVEQAIQETNPPKSQAWQDASARIRELVIRFTGKAPKDAWGRK